MIREIQLGRYEVNFPINTLIINVIGCFLLALIITVAFEILKFSSNLRIGIASGLLGAFTTFSTLCKETAGLISQEFYFLAVSYIAVSIILGLLAVYLGVAIARKVIVRRIREKNHMAADRLSDKSEGL